VLNELETAMEGKRSGRAYKTADLLPVRVVSVDEARGKVDLTLADSETELAEHDAEPHFARARRKR
jgi:predicted RNA-binding protein with RPS1 domain